jgi:putative flavoprotein involved in K+ transport
MNRSRNVSAVIVGGGQAGLAMSRSLTERSIDHVVLERGDVAHSWTTERWDSLRLLTPNWLSRLPGCTYDGPDPDGYMTAAEVAAHLRRYREVIGAPVISGTKMESVATAGSGFRVHTDDGVWHARSVVVATGACSTPRVPAVARELPERIRTITPVSYRNPSQLDDGRVLVVGASASGLQIADELARSGREVTVAVGEHVRMCRTYRGMDLHWWLDRLGILDERYDEVDDIQRARRLPSLQLIGSPERRDLDLNALSDRGVDLVGRLVGCATGKLQFSGSFANLCASADLKLNRLLDSIDAYALEHGLDAALTAADRPAPTRVGEPALEMDAATLGTIVWATGYRPEYPWLDPRLLDPKGAVVHDGGVMACPGMYVLGLPFMRRRKSSFLDGVGADTADLVGALHASLDESAARIPRPSVNMEGWGSGSATTSSTKTRAR